MCWIGTKETIVSMGETAKEDITVYKVMVLMDERLYSYIQGYQYEIGKEYALKEKIRCYAYDGVGTYKITKGFHSYGSECNAYLQYDCCVICSPRKETGHTYYETLQIYGNNNGIAIVECVVPKGSIYFKNTGGELVSDRIQITGNIVFYRDLIVKKPYKCVSFQDIFHE